MRFLVTAAIGVLLSLSTTAFAAEQPTDPEATFHAGTIEWIDAYNAGEPDRIIALYSEDAIVMPPDAPSVTGDAALRSFLADEMAEAKKGGITIVLTGDDEADTSGDLGWHRGTFKVVGEGGASLGTGKYLEIWERQQGKWRITRDIWNNDAAPAAPPAPPATADRK
jgi:ketosteroid isomerase-like protein